MYAQLYMVVYFSIPILNTRLTHHGLACYMTKFESQSFRLHSKQWGSLCSARELLAQSAVSACICVEVKGQWEGQSLAIFLIW
jgi:hypothetical protein